MRYPLGTGDDPLVTLEEAAGGDEKLFTLASEQDAAAVQFVGPQREVFGFGQVEGVETHDHNLRVRSVREMNAE